MNFFESLLKINFTSIKSKYRVIMTFNPCKKDSKLYYNIMCKIKACIENLIWYYEA